MPPTSANELTPPAEQVERFRRDLEAITGEAPSAERKLGVAVSGGADSLALLLLAAAAYPGAVIAATVDHGLRPEAAEEAASVRRLCALLGVLHDVLAGAMASGNLQEGARDLRYSLLADWAKGRAQWIATAHQRDDVAETFLMRARRGAGVGGLAAMATTRSLGDARLIRPLLRWTRAELAAIVSAASLEAAFDPSNTDPRFDRSRIRRLLALSPELSAERLALAANNLRHAEDALEWAVEREWVARSRSEAGSIVIDATGLPYELRRRLVERALHAMLSSAKEVLPFDKLRANDAGKASPKTVRAEFVEAPYLLEAQNRADQASFRGPSLDRLLTTLDSGGTGTIAGVKASAKRGEWRFSAAPARRSH